ncbi:MAG: hypothetical protein AAFV80_20275, partial [Bacteroidota bacterium]
LFAQSRLAETLQFINKHKIQVPILGHLVQLFKDLAKPLHQSERTSLLDQSLQYYLDHRGQIDLFSGYRMVLQSILMYFHLAAIQPYIQIPDSSSFN